jgi:hypothetical protein
MQNQLNIEIVGAREAYLELSRMWKCILGANCQNNRSGEDIWCYYEAKSTPRVHYQVHSSQLLRWAEMVSQQAASVKMPPMELLKEFLTRGNTSAEGITMKSKAPGAGTERGVVGKAKKGKSSGETDRAGDSAHNTITFNPVIKVSGFDRSRGSISGSESDRGTEKKKSRRRQVKKELRRASAPETSPPRKVRIPILSSSPIIPRDASAAALAAEYLEWFQEQEETGDDAWDADVRSAALCLYDSRLTLEGLRELTVSELVEQFGIKRGIAQRLVKRLKAWIRERRPITRDGTVASFQSKSAQVDEEHSARHSASAGVGGLRAQQPGAQSAAESGMRSQALRSPSVPLWLFQDSLDYRQPPSIPPSINFEGAMPNLSDATPEASNEEDVETASADSAPE